MKKLKRPKKPVSRKDVEEKIHRVRRIFIASCVGSVILLLALLYIYSSYNAQWAENRALKRLAASEPAARLEGLAVIRRLNLVEHTPKICELFRNDSSRQVREAALEVITVLRDPNSIPTLVYALGDDKDKVAEGALQALRSVIDVELDWHDVVQWWQHNEMKYADAYRREEDTGLPIIDNLTLVLENGDKFQRADAVERLARLRHPLAIPALTLATADSESIVQEPAVEALAALKEQALQSRESR